MKFPLSMLAYGPVLLLYRSCLGNCIVEMSWMFPARSGRHCLTVGVLVLWPSQSFLFYSVPCALDHVVDLISCSWTCHGQLFSPVDQSWILIITSVCCKEPLLGEDRDLIICGHKDNYLFRKQIMLAGFSLLGMISFLLSKL